MTILGVRYAAYCEELVLVPLHLLSIACLIVISIDAGCPVGYEVSWHGSFLELQEVLVLMYNTFQICPFVIILGVNFIYLLQQQTLHDSQLP